MGDKTPTNETEKSGKTMTIDNLHPYHLNNSDSPGMTLVNTVFDGRGYQGWRRSVLLSLSAKKKLGFINGGCKTPDLESDEYEHWSCVNDIPWILNALSKDIANSVKYSKTAKDSWDGKTELAKSLEDQRLIQFLMGLKDVYAQARGNILMLNPLPNMDLAYSLFLQDENQREAYANAKFTSDLASFMVNGQNKQFNTQLMAQFAAFMAVGKGRNNQRLKIQSGK
ncbi:uncharacterized protein LOC132601751 [Lycium barbarum]|uniref:uncharacterized protein LOC132601751 n=1 Tax=Lycium barbarum TaxID=112863 RepID=UPI00293E43DB|nr:uncharacterized protein LOC132601751 [Lycium barbarum]